MLAGQSATNPSTNTSQTHSPRTAPLDLFIALYEDSTYDIDLPCDKFAKYEMWHKLAGLVVGKANTTTDDSLALFGQQAS